MTVPGTTPASRVQRLVRSAGVWAVFAAAGPAIGGLLVFCCLYPVMMVFGLDTAALSDGSAQPGTFNPSTFLGAALFVIALGYAFGGPQAVLTGAWAAYVTYKYGVLTTRGIVFAAFVATILWIALIYSPLNPIGDGNAGDAGKADSAARIALTLIPIGIVSALFVRRLCGLLGLAPTHRV